MGLLQQIPAPAKELKRWPFNEEVSCDYYKGTLEWPKVSIVIPTYNQGQFIEETIRSILLQNYPNLEIIVIDGGSTDNTVQVIKKYEPWIQYWVSEKDRGQCHAINKGLEKATGEIFNWLNSDDYLEKNALYTIASHFIEEPGIDIVRGRIRYFSENNTHESNVIEPNTPIEELIATLPHNVPQASTYIRMALLKDENVGLFNEALNFVFDLEWMLRYYVQFDRNKILEDQQIFSWFRFHEDSKTISQTDRFMLETKAVYRDLYLKVKETREIGGLMDSFTLKRDVLKKVKVCQTKAVQKSAHLFLLFLSEVNYYHRLDRAEVSHMLSLVKFKYLPLKKKLRYFKIKLVLALLPARIITSLRKARTTC